MHCSILCWLEFGLGEVCVGFEIFGGLDPVGMVDVSRLSIGEVSGICIIDGLFEKF